MQSSLWICSLRHSVVDLANVQQCILESTSAFSQVQIWQRAARGSMLDIRHAQGAGDPSVRMGVSGPSAVVHSSGGVQMRRGTCGGCGRWGWVFNWSSPSVQESPGCGWWSWLTDLRINFQHPTFFPTIPFVYQRNHESSAIIIRTPF